MKSVVATLAVTAHAALLATTIATAAPARAGTLEEIRETRQIKLGYRRDTPPFSSLSEAGMPEGFTIDLCRIIAKDIQAELELDEMNISWVGVNAEDRFDAIVEGRVHVVCGASTVTFSRQEEVDFSNLIYATGAGLMRRADSPINRLLDLSGKRVSVVTGTTTETVLRAQLKQNLVDADVVVVPNHAEALQLLNDKKIDAMAGDQATLLGLGAAGDGAQALVITEELLSFEPYALPLPRNDADFRLAVNRALSALYVRGDVGRSWQQWFGQFDVQATSMLLMLYRLNSFMD